MPSSQKCLMHSDTVSGDVNMPVEVYELKDDKYQSTQSCQETSMQRPPSKSALAVEGIVLDDVSTAEQDDGAKDGLGLTPVYGWRWGLLFSSLCLGLLLAMIESSITATALVTIARSFNDFPGSTWVILSYLLGYSGFAIILPRMGDLIGRKAVTLAAWAMFAAFSLGAGLSKTLTQLIVCRALQGIGGTGMYSMTMVVSPQITPVKRWPLMSTAVGLVLGISSVSGPVLGGVITQHSTWRWIYLFNAPLVAVGVLPLILLWPSPTKVTQSSAWKHFDAVGSLLILVASSLLIFVLNQVGADFYQWHDPIIIAFTTIACLSWCGFVCWIAWFSYRPTARIDPIFPGALAAKRPQGPSIITSCLAGFAYFITVINLPQRFQIVNGLTPVGAGVRLMPLLAFVAFGTATAGGLSKKTNRTPESLIVGSVFITVGCGLLSTLSKTPHIEPKQYGYQTLIGYGLGMVFGAVTLMASIETKPDQMAAFQGALSQARILGGSTSLAIATIVLNKNITRILGPVVSPSQLQSLRHSFGSIEEMDLSQKRLAAEAFAESFNTEMRICCYISIVTVLSSICTWKRKKTPLPVNQ